MTIEETMIPLVNTFVIATPGSALDRNGNRSRVVVITVCVGELVVSIILPVNL